MVSLLALCSACDQDVPSKADVCPNCGLKLDEPNETRIIEQRRRKLRDNIYHYRMSSYLALALLIAAFGWFLVGSGNLTAPPSSGPYILFAIGAVIYLVIRVLLFKCKFALRKLSSR